MKKEDVFSLEELYFICSVIGAGNLYGLPDLSMFTMIKQEAAHKATQQMQAKGLLDKNGKLTPIGGYILNAFKQYHESKTYLVVNGDFIGFNNEQELIILSSPDQVGIQMEITTKEAYFRKLYQNVRLIRREAEEEEQTFLKKLVPRSERAALNQLPLEGGLLLKKVRQPTEETWFIKRHEGKLYGYQGSRVYQLSQYWLIKWLLDELNIPISKEEVRQQ
ncbi:DUF5081 family protein [Isobaculum melis]|uniref:Uncharacterized protein n=1 Tax=Isobaculum melis TaxID=142588 RepID=A0A1H9PWV1_9LACT|nr:DUF5081 family protein [Isobaculum melis]SER52674.1 protein of unknown function [Isobaculum melis]